MLKNIELEQNILHLERQMEALRDQYFLKQASELEQVGQYSDLLCQTRARVSVNTDPEYLRLQSALDAAKHQRAVLDATVQTMKAIFNLDEFDLAEQRQRRHTKNWN